jgi:hypothetical protein
MRQSVGFERCDYRHEALPNYLDVKTCITATQAPLSLCGSATVDVSQFAAHEFIGSCNLAFLHDVDPVRRGRSGHRGRQFPCHPGEVPFAADQARVRHKQRVRQHHAICVLHDRHDLTRSAGGIVTSTTPDRPLGAAARSRPIVTRLISAARQMTVTN